MHGPADGRSRVGLLAVRRAASLAIQFSGMSPDFFEIDGPVPNPNLRPHAQTWCFFCPINFPLRVRFLDLFLITSEETRPQAGVANLLAHIMDKRTQLTRGFPLNAFEIARMPRGHGQRRMLTSRYEKCV